MNIEQERKDFEGFASKHGLSTAIESNLHRSHVVAWMWKAWQARAALQSQATEAFPCRIVEVDFETDTVTLEMHGKYTVSSGHKYLCDAPLQLQDAEDALIVAMQEAVDLLGPNAPSCCGCEYEWNHALRVLRDAIDHARRIEGIKDAVI